MTLLSLPVFAGMGMTFSSENVTTVLNPPRTSEVFVPPGFDDLDDVEITYINHSRSSCFIKTFPMAPEIDHEKKTIRISNMSMVLEGDFCKSRATSSPTTLKVGELEAGSYKVEFETSEGEFTPYLDVNIAKSKTQQKDDFEYASLDVNELTVRVNKEKKQIELSLPGSFPNGCYAFKEIKVIDDRSPTVIEILPIVDMVTDICTQDIQFYTKLLNIPYKVSEPTKKLLHIRSSDGVAINRVVTLE